ncbi:collagen alpha-1(I) chain-like, partial [Lagopus leucura]|uniref:collagen alpha-1(I) chain-like n=1 Tax=Lagopus leucura TaxID=30410 RepID=UPI001C686A8A
SSVGRGCGCSAALVFTLTFTFQPEAVKKEVKKEEASRGSSGLKKYKEGSGAVQTAAAHPAVEPSAVKKEPVSIPAVEDELPAVKTEPSEPHPEGAQRDPGAGLAEQSSGEAGAELTGAPMGAAGAQLPAAKAEEKLLPPPSTGKEEVIADGAASKLPVHTVGSTAQKGEELGAAGPGAAGEQPGAEPGRAAAPLAAGRTSGAVPKAVPAAGPAQMGPCGIAPRNPGKKTSVDEQTDREKQGAPTAGVNPEPEDGAATGGMLAGDGAGMDVEVRAEGAAGEQGSRLKCAAEVEKKRQRCEAEVGAAVENAGRNGKEKKGSCSKAPQSKETRAAKTKEAAKAAASNSSSSIQEPSSAPKAVLKASVPDALAPGAAVHRSKPALCKGEEQAASSKARPQGAAAGQKKAAWKEEGQPRAGPIQPSSSAKGGNGRNASQQEKDSHVEPRAGSKQSQQGESRSSGTRRDGSTKVSRARGLLADCVLLACVQHGPVGLRSPSPSSLCFGPAATLESHGSQNEGETWPRFETGQAGWSSP